MFVVVAVWFYCSSRLTCLILAYHSNLMLQCFIPLSCLLWRLSYNSYTIFLKNTSAFLGFPKNNFWVFLSVPHLVELCQNCGWARSEPYVPSHITEPPCLTLCSVGTILSGLFCLLSEERFVWDYFVFGTVLSVHHFFATFVLMLTPNRDFCSHELWKKSESYGY